MKASMEAMTRGLLGWWPPRLRPGRTATRLVAAKAKAREDDDLARTHHLLVRSSSGTSSSSTRRPSYQHVPAAASRLQIGVAGLNMAPCTTRVSAFEKAMRVFAEKTMDNVITPVLETVRITR